MNLGFETTPEQKSKFENFYDLVIETNKKFNLTAITDEKEFCEKHFLDSVSAAKLLPHNASVVDIGAGAGFPSVPLKIIRDDLNFTLVDSLAKRVNFLNEVKEKLCFDNLYAIHSRAEDFAKTNRESFDVGVARAVAPLSTLCELVAPLVKVGGILVLYKGNNFQTEINLAKNSFKKLGLKFESVVHYILPNSQADRSLIVLKKITNTPVKYPRQQNMPKLSPL